MTDLEKLRSLLEQVEPSFEEVSGGTYRYMDRDKIMDTVVPTTLLCGECDSFYYGFDAVFDAEGAILEMGSSPSIRRTPPPWLGRIDAMPTVVGLR